MTKTKEGAVIDPEPSQSEGKELAEYQGRGNQIAKASDQKQSILTKIDLQNEEMPDASETERVPLDLASEYWSPEVDGEMKPLVFSHFDVSLVPDKYGPSKGANGEMVELETAYFFEKKGDSITMIRQASKVLLSTLKSNRIEPGTLLDLVFKGRKKLGNGNMGDTWGVFPRKFLNKKNGEVQKT